MTRDLIIGIDAGTTVIKSVAFSLSGRQLGVASRNNVYKTSSDGRAEQDLQQTWTRVVETLRELTETLPGLDQRLAAIAVTGQGDGTWLIDRDGQPVGDALLWLDSRAADLADSIATRPDYQRLYAINATGVNACQQGPQLAWLKQHEPERIAQAATAFHCKDWLYFQLTGERATDPSEGTFSFGDYRLRDYSPELIDGFGIPELARLLPPIVDGTSTASTLGSDAAALTGLKAGTPVVLGFIDVVCSALGGGLFDPKGQVGCSVLGSTGVHMRLALSPEDVVLTTEHSGYTIPFPYQKSAIQMQSNMAAMININWIADIAREVLALEGIERSREDLFARIEANMAALPAGQLLYHPYISPSGERGPFLEPAARATLSGIDTDVGYFALARAVYEGLGLATRDCYAAMGALPSEVRVTGGGARSTTLREILSATLGATVRTVDRAESGAAGAAMIAAIQLGVYEELETCVADWVTPYLGDSIEFDPESSPVYDPLYSIYARARENMRPTWREMANTKKGP